MKNIRDIPLLDIVHKLYFNMNMEGDYIFKTVIDGFELILILYGVNSVGFSSGYFYCHYIQNHNYNIISYGTTGLSIIINSEKIDITEELFISENEDDKFNLSVLDCYDTLLECKHIYDSTKLFIKKYR